MAPEPAAIDTGWQLPDTACALLSRLVAEHKPDLIVECGSGRSTLVLAQAAAEYGGAVVALEHERKYAQATRWMTVNTPGEVEVVWAPLEPHGMEGLLTDKWYARRAWDGLRGIGMLMVDGPPGGSSPFARHPALPLLRDRLLPGCVLVLDDVDRDREKTIVRDWGVELTVFQHEAAAIGYGIVDV